MSPPTPRPSTGPDPTEEQAPDLAVGDELQSLAARSVGSWYVDAVVVLLLRLLRRLWAPVLVLGLAWLVVTDALDPESAPSLSSVGDYARALLTPFAGVAIAVAIRLGTYVLGTLAAFPVAVAEQRRTAARGSRRMQSLGDLAMLTMAYRSLRFTAVARDAAAARLGGLGRTLVLADRVVTWLVPASVLLFIVVLVVEP